VEDYLAELFSGDDVRAEQAAVKISRLPAGERPASLAALEEALASPLAERRWWAARALAEIQDPLVPPLLAGLLSDEAAAVRQCAALGLRLQPDPQAVPALIQALSDPDPLAAELAADALAAVGGEAVPALLEVLTAGEQPDERPSRVPAVPGRDTRLEALRALAAIGDPRAIPALFAALDEDSALMEHWASEGLERMGVGMTFFKP
jgi:HEAT repeat protein